MSPFGPPIPPRPRVYFRNQPLNDALPTAHYPLPTFLRPLFSYSYELFVVPKEVKSFAIKQIRTLAQNTAAARVLLLGPFTSQRSRATSHVLSVVCSLFAVTLRSFLHSFSLFSTACSLFSKNTRGGGSLCALCACPSAGGPARRRRALGVIVCRSFPASLSFAFLFDSRRAG